MKSKESKSKLFAVVLLLVVGLHLGKGRSRRRGSGGAQLGHFSTMEDAMAMIINKCSMSPELNFPCRGVQGRSERVPESVHQLRPGDIDVIAAVGDSLTAGTGALADNIVRVTYEYRGVSFCMGGDSDWKDFFTLPNVLKIFNPKLYGYSVGKKQISDDIDTALNLSESGAESDDVVRQVRKLVQKMKADPEINFSRDWKLVTVLVGHNDICSYACRRHPPSEEKNGSPDSYIRNVAKALDILQHEMPRTFVNLMPIADVTVLLDIREKPIPCIFTHPYGCACLFGKDKNERLSRSEMKYLLNKYLLGLEQLISSGRYDTREDFTVVIQPTLVRGTLPKLRTRSGFGSPNLSYLAPDCFHWAQKLHARVARGLWNNLLEPVGSKSRNFDPKVPLLCPTKHTPYLATSANSRGRSSGYMTDMTRDFQDMMRSIGNKLLCPI